MSRNVFNCLEACKGLPFPYEQCVAECENEFTPHYKSASAVVDPSVARARFATFKASLSHHLNHGEEMSKKKKKRDLYLAAGGGLLAVVAAVGAIVYLKNKKP